MRVLAALLLLSAALPLAVPTAVACHPDPAVSDLPNPKGYYIVPDAGYGGCPHEATLCLQVWRESNGQPGLQRTGSNPDHAVLVVCPLP